MATLVIRSLKDSVKESIRLRAAQHGRSIEAEACAILEASTHLREHQAPEEHMYHRIRQAVDQYGGADLMVPPRSGTRQPPDFASDDYKAYDD